jgi:O-acetyl-ADP-ribose deacetylase (regulator of RNase III)
MSRRDTLDAVAVAFSDCRVIVQAGDLLDPALQVEGLASSDDNYFSMAGGVSAAMLASAGPEVRDAAQARAPVRAGDVIVTGAGALQAGSVQAILHAAVVDLDADIALQPESIGRAVAACLRAAEEHGLRSVALPAFGTGAGEYPLERAAGLIATAVKSYLATPRSLERIHLVVYDPSPERERLRTFLAAAMPELATPYDPAIDTLQAQDPLAHPDALAQVAAAIRAGYHVAIVGGRKVGKSSVLAALACREVQQEIGLVPDARVVLLRFGSMMPGTPATIIYRKLLRALLDQEADAARRQALAAFPVNQEEQRAESLARLLEQVYPDQRVVVLAANLAGLVHRLSGPDSWADLHVLRPRLQVVFTAPDVAAGRSDLDLFREAVGAARFNAEFQVVQLRCLTPDQRQAFVGSWCRRYLGREVKVEEEQFFADAGGYHPYLLRLAMYHVFRAYRLARPLAPLDQPLEGDVRSAIEVARAAMEPAATNFFDTLLAEATVAERTALDAVRRIWAPAQDLARRVQAQAEMQRLRDGTHERVSVRPDVLERLAARGYLAGDEPCAPGFLRWLNTRMGAKEPEQGAQPMHAVISILGPERSGGREFITNVVHDGGPLLLAPAAKPYAPDITVQKLREFDAFLQRQRRGEQARSGFTDLSEVGAWVLLELTTNETKRVLDTVTDAATFSLDIDERLAAIPWELMFLADPARPVFPSVGRRVISPGQAANINPPVRDAERLEALLIGNPTGDLAHAADEVQDVQRLLTAALGDRAHVTSLVSPAQCSDTAVVTELGRGSYGLLHYSGHARFERSRSAWWLPEAPLYTDRLTSFLQRRPPAVVFCSACESGREELEPGALRYENQAGGLASACLKAGVQCYIGALWPVSEVASRLVAARFYEALLRGKDRAGRCLAAARRWLYEHGQEYGIDRRRGDWAAFVLYGSPEATGRDLFPCLSLPD